MTHAAVSTRRARRASTQNVQATRLVDKLGPMKPEPIIHLTPGKRVLFLTKDPDLIRRQLRGELDLLMKDLSIDDLTRGYDAITQLIIREGGLFPFAKAVERGDVEIPIPHTPPRPMTMGEKILARHVRGVAPGTAYVKPGDAIVLDVDGGYTHEFTTAQVHHFLSEEYGPDYAIRNPQKFAVFEDHLIYADEVTKMRPFLPKIEILRDMQRAFQQHTSCRDFSANGRVSPGICHEVAREYIVDPGDFIQATDSHTCMAAV